MISAEAPVLFAKAAEIFITELSLRAWIHTEDNKRRTLQRNDIAMAISKYDQFDFLIDIVPRDELTKPPPTKRTNSSSGMIDGQGIIGQQTLTLGGGQQVTIGGLGGNQLAIPSDQVQMYIQQAIQQQQQQQQQQQSQATTQGPQQLQVLQAPGPAGGVAICINSQGQLVQVQVPPSAPSMTAPSASAVTGPSNVPPQVQNQSNDQSASNNHNSSSSSGTSGGQLIQLNTAQIPSNQGGGDGVQQQQQPQQQIVVHQHIVNSNGQVQQVPLQINAQQLQQLRMQLAASGGQMNAGQPIIIQTGQHQQQQYQIANAGGQQFVIASGGMVSGDDGQEDSQDGSQEEDDDEDGLPVTAE